MTPKFRKSQIKKRESLGEKLAKKRAALGYEIKDIEKATKIRAKHIEYIEQGEWDKLPPDVYVRGFLQSYSKFLRLDPQKVLVLYYKEKGVTENIKETLNKKNKSKNEPLKSPKITITPKKILFFSISLAIIAILGYIGWQVSLLAAPPKIEITSPEDNLKVSESSIIIEGKTDPGAEVFINNIAIGVEPEGEFKEKIGLQEGVNLIKIVAKNRLNKETAVTRTIVADLAQISPEKETNNKLSLTLLVGPRPSTVKISVDGKEIASQSSIMLPGSTQTIEGKKSITIAASDGGSVSIILNGKDLGKLGKDKESTEKTFSQSSL